MGCCNIFDSDVFDEENNLLKEYMHWKLLVRNRNMTLGNCVAITKEHYKQFSELSAEELADFANLVKDIEKALKAAFNFEKINYLMLMMNDKHTHFHIIPRYSETKEFAGKQWTDEGWPKMPEHSKEKVSQEVLDKVKEEIKKQIL